MALPKDITTHDVKKALRRLARGAPHDFASPTRWVVKYPGKLFPPKAVLGQAAERAAGRKLGPYDFQSGPSAWRLRALGAPPVLKRKGAPMRALQATGAIPDRERRAVP